MLILLERIVERFNLLAVVFIGQQKLTMECLQMSDNFWIEYRVGVDLVLRLIQYLQPHIPSRFTRFFVIFWQ